MSNDGSPRFKLDRVAVDGLQAPVDFSISPGEKAVFLHGVNGGGKTTVLRLICALLGATSLASVERAVFTRAALDLQDPGDAASGCRLVLVRQGPLLALTVTPKSSVENEPYTLTWLVGATSPRFHHPIQARFPRVLLLPTRTKFRLQAEAGNAAESGACPLSPGERRWAQIRHLLEKGDADSLLVIDEPERSLHVCRQRDFSRELAAHAGKQGFSSIIATHSPYVVGAYTDCLVAIGPQRENPQ
jgi:ABC-type glutathione transport system ATPase component